MKCYSLCNTSTTLLLRRSGVVGAFFRRCSSVFRRCSEKTPYYTGQFALARRVKKISFVLHCTPALRVLAQLKAEQKRRSKRSGAKISGERHLPFILKQDHSSKKTKYVTVCHWSILTLHGSCYLDSRKVYMNTKFENSDVT